MRLPPTIVGPADERADAPKPPALTCAVALMFTGVEALSFGGMAVGSLHGWAKTGWEREKRLIKRNNAT
jgi:hypothetical protein